MSRLTDQRRRRDLQKRDQQVPITVLFPRPEGLDPNEAPGFLLHYHHGAAMKGHGVLFLEAVPFKLKHAPAHTDDGMRIVMQHINQRRPALVLQSDKPGEMVCGFTRPGSVRVELEGHDVEQLTESFLAAYGAWGQQMIDVFVMGACLRWFSWEKWHRETSGTELPTDVTIPGTGPEPDFEHVPDDEPPAALPHTPPVENPT